MIAVVDYGMGNLRSVANALARLDAPAQATNDSAVIAAANKLILPGVGAFGDAIGALHAGGLVEPICDFVKSGRPFLGICLGLQLLFDVSYEDGEHRGLGILPGKVVRFDVCEKLKIPHMGWNRLIGKLAGAILAGLPNEAHVYFVHSYHAVVEQEADVAAVTDYGYDFPSVIWRDNICATQFHPEKSQEVGRRILQNFVEL